MAMRIVQTAAALVLLSLLALPAAAAEALHRQWDELLARHVENGTVDYQGFKQDEAALDRYLTLLDSTDPESLPRPQQLAFYLNAYNAYTVKLILAHFKNGRPVESIRDIGGFFTGPWDLAIAGIGGTTLTLDTIEHEIIRPRFQEPRIHFAANCASQSCPPLISEAYRGERLDEQLERSTRAFLTDSRHNYLEGATLYVSSIFKWYSEDFPAGPVAFFLAHTQGTELHERLAKLGDTVRLRYLDYDWSLNDALR